MKTEKIPYKIYLNENEMPKAWYNLRADMSQKPAPLLNPGTHQPMKAEELAGVFCDELIEQELDNDTPFLKFQKKYEISIRCTVHHHWYVLTAWKKNLVHLQKSIINLRETIQAAATS